MATKRKQLEKQLSSLRKQIIAELKSIVKKGTLELYDKDVFINNSNTEEMLKRITPTGADLEEGEAIPWKEMSADLLLLILQVVEKNYIKLTTKE